MAAQHSVKIGTQGASPPRWFDEEATRKRARLHQALKVCPPLKGDLNRYTVYEEKNDHFAIIPRATEVDGP